MIFYRVKKGEFAGLNILCGVIAPPASPLMRVNGLYPVDSIFLSRFLLCSFRALARVASGAFFFSTCLLCHTPAVYAQSGEGASQQKADVALNRGVETREAALRERHQQDPEVDKKVIEELLIQAYITQAQGDEASTAAIVKRLHRLCDGRLAKDLPDDRRANLLLVKAALAEDFGADVASAMVLAEQAAALLPTDRDVSSKVERLKRREDAAPRTDRKVENK